jgi:adenosylcobinamide-GDP ribazoletransferase
VSEPSDEIDEPTEWWRRDQAVSWRDLIAAVGQLTPLRLGSDELIGRSAIFYPLVGLLVGACWWAVDSVVLRALESGWRAAGAIAVLALLNRGRGVLGVARAVAALATGRHRDLQVARLTDGWGGAIGVIAILAECVLQWWGLQELRKARTPAMLFGPMLAAWSVVVLAYGSRALRADGRRLKYAREVGFREFAWASVFSFGVLFGFGQATGVGVGVLVAALVVTWRTGLHAVFDGVHDSLVWAASEATLTAVLITFALLERGV